MTRLGYTRLERKCVCVCVCEREREREEQKKNFTKPHVHRRVDERPYSTSLGNIFYSQQSASIIKTITATVESWPSRKRTRDTKECTGNRLLCRDIQFQHKTHATLPLFLVIHTTNRRRGTFFCLNP